MSSQANDEKALVAYFSATGTTKHSAEKLAEVAHADLFEIAPVERYSAADLNWNDKQSRSSVEMRDPNSRPAVRERIAHPEQYHVVYLGFPIWWYTAPTIINTFLEENDLRGKRIIFFATSGGSTTTQTFRHLEAAYPDLDWTDGGLLNSPTTSRAEAIVKLATDHK